MLWMSKAEKFALVKLKFFVCITQRHKLLLFTFCLPESIHLPFSSCSHQTNVYWFPTPRAVLSYTTCLGLNGIFITYLAFSSLRSSTASNECASPPGRSTKQWTLQLMYDNYIYFSLEWRTNKKHQQSQDLRWEKAKKVQIFGKLEENFFPLFLFSVFLLPLPK